MQTKEHTKELKELEGRRYFLTLKPERMSLQATLIWASINLIAGIVGLWNSYANHAIDSALFFKVLIDPYTGFFLTVSMLFFIEGYYYDIDPATRYEFSMRKKYRGMLLDLLNVFSIYGSLLLLLYWIFYEIHLFYWFIIAPLLLFTIGRFLVKFIKEFPKLLMQYEAHGVSTIQLEKEVVKVGDIVSITFCNDKVCYFAKEVNVYFRNLKEDIIQEGEIKRHVTLVLYEDYQSIALTDTETPFQIRVPCQEVEPTDFDVEDDAYYWELEISNKSLDFYSRFLIEVQA